MPVLRRKKKRTAQRSNRRAHFRDEQLPGARFKPEPFNFARAARLSSDHLRRLSAESAESNRQAPNSAPERSRNADTPREGGAPPFLTGPLVLPIEAAEEGPLRGKQQRCVSPTFGLPSPAASGDGDELSGATSTTATERSYSNAAADPCSTTRRNSACQPTNIDSVDLPTVESTEATEATESPDRFCRISKPVTSPEFSPTLRDTSDKVIDGPAGGARVKDLHSLTSDELALCSAAPGVSFEQERKHLV